jgi:hypothetical protein
VCASTSRIAAGWSYSAASSSEYGRAPRSIDARQPGRHALKVFDGYGQHDLLFGRDSARVVHPHLVAALQS